MIERGCPIAQRLGLRPGITLGQAQAIAPELIALPVDDPQDEAALRQLADWAICFSPTVEPVLPGALLLDITGCAHLFGCEYELARQAVNGLAAQGYSATAAIADSGGASYALATYGCISGSLEKGTRALPDAVDAYTRANDVRIRIALPGQASAAIAPLPPEALRISPQIAQRLLSLGIRTIGDLLMLPRSSLPSRFGEELIQRLRQALDETNEPITPHQSEDIPRQRLRFDSPVTDLAPIQMVAARMVEQLLKDVVRRGMSLRRLECLLYFQRTSPRVASLVLARGTRTAAIILKLLAQRLESTNVRTGVIALAVAVREVVEWRPGQGDLFEPRAAGDEEDFITLLDRLANRLGHAAIVRPQLVDDYQPEFSYRYQVTADVGIDNPIPSRLPPPAIAPSELRPMRLFPKPTLIRVIALAPDGPPTWFASATREYRLLRARGPERLETAWWRGPDVKRDYFRVTAETGEQFWVFHDMRENRWYLHGVFD